MSRTLYNAQGERMCSRCLRGKDVGEFAKGNCRDGLSSWCRLCFSEDHAAKVAADPDYNRRQLLWSRYHITLEHWNEMFEAQGGVCKICGNPPSEKSPLHVDHDHACCPTTKMCCGKCIRGLVCWHCNVFIGNLEGRRGRAALAYLGWKVVMQP